MRTTRFPVTAIVLIVAATSLNFGQTATTRTAHVVCNIAQPPGLTQPISIAAKIYRVARDSYGGYQYVGEPQSGYALFDPRFPTDAVQVEADLALGDGIEYELRVVVLDKDGNPRQDGAYLFVRQSEGADLLDETFALHPDQVNELPLMLRWVSVGDQAKSNFFQVSLPKGESDFVLAAFVNDSTNIDLFK